MTANDRITIDPATLDRFWSRVDVSGECWRRAGAHSRGGYSHLSFRGRVIDAHRLSWTIATGHMPSAPERVCHTCDVHDCVRNDDAGVYVVDGVEYERHGHLFLASAAANTADMVAKGRHWHQRLSGDDVQEILALADSGLRQVRIAERFGITKTHVGGLLKRHRQRSAQETTETRQ